MSKGSQEVHEGIGCLVCGVWKNLSEFSRCRQEMENRGIKHVLTPEQDPLHLWGWISGTKKWGLFHAKRKAK